MNKYQKNKEDFIWELLNELAENNIDYRRKIWGDWKERLLKLKKGVCLSQA